ncbi:MAG TPA: hypothetical protein VGM93_03830 [Acidimicrobiales bacterium]
MTSDRVVLIVAWTWSVLGAGIALAALGGVNDDALWFVALCTVAASGLAWAAAWCSARLRVGLGGGLLLASGLLMPTFALAWVNLVPIGVGLWAAVGAVHRRAISKPGT